MRFNKILAAVVASFLLASPLPAFADYMSGGGSSLTTPVSVVNGGTNATSQTNNAVCYFDGTRLTTGSILLFNAGSAVLTVGSTSNASTLQIGDNTGTSQATLNLGSSAAGAITNTLFNIYGGSGRIRLYDSAHTNYAQILTTTPTAAGRTFTLPDADSNPIIPDTGASNNFLTGISSGGVISKAQPDIANVTATAHAALVGNSGGTAITGVAPSTSGNVLTSNGTDWTSAAPAAAGYTTTTSAASGFTVTSGVDTNLTMTNAFSNTITLPNGTPPTIGQRVCVCEKSAVGTIDAGSGSVIGSAQFTNGQTVTLAPGTGSFCIEYRGAQYINSISGTSKLWEVMGNVTNSITVVDNGGIQFYHSSNNGLNAVFNLGTGEDPSAQRNVLFYDAGTNTQVGQFANGGAATNDFPEAHKGSGQGTYLDTINSKSSSITTVNGSTSGTYKWSMPFRSAGYKVVSITMQALTDAGGTITFPTAFTDAPDIFDGSGLAGVTGTATTTTFTMQATVAKTGTILLVGR